MALLENSTKHLRKNLYQFYTDLPEYAKNEPQSIFLTLLKNYLRLDHRPKCKTPNNKICGIKHKKKSVTLGYTNIY